MLCVKCGQEYEGAQCPRCEGPVILVNNSDYLARKKAYEEKQALKEKSASSSKSSKPEQATSAKKRTSGKLGTNADRRGASRPGAGAKNRGAASQDEEILQFEGENQENKRHYTVRKRRVDLRGAKIAASVILVILILFSCLGIYKLVTRRNYAIYMGYNGKIYDMTGMESEYVCDYAEAIFAADHKTFYVPEYPEGIDGTLAIQSLASNNGKFFGTVTFDGKTYTLYVWNDKKTYVVSENEYSKEILMLSDDGEIVYTSTPILNSEGKVGGVTVVYGELVSEKKTSVKKISEKRYDLKNVGADNRQVYVYSGSKLIFCLDNDGMFSIYNYDKGTNTVIDESTDKLMAMREDQDNTFAKDTEKLNESKNAKAMVFCKADMDYYYDCEEAKAVRLGKNTSYVTDYVYDKATTSIYRISDEEIMVAEIKKDEITEYKGVDSIDKERDYLYYSERLIYVNGDGELISIKDGKSKCIDEDVVAGSLSKVYNKSGALTYYAAGKQYYLVGVNGKKIELPGGSEKTEGTCYYKNKIYYYDSDNKLNTCSVKGKGEQNIGNVDRFWIGTELK